MSFTIICLHLGVLGYKSYQMHVLSSTTLDQSLEFKSSYFGLEGINRNPSSPRLPPIMNFPLIMAQVNSSEPDQVIPYAHKRPTEMGTIYSDDRTLHITSQVRSSRSSTLDEINQIPAVDNRTIPNYRLGYGKVQAEADDTGVISTRF